jgi:outer membrane protein
MRTAALTLSLLLLTWPARAEAPRKLDLRAAINRALALDPQVVSSLISVDRGKLAVLRAQLDRVSLKVDGTLSEQWYAVGMGGPNGTSTSGAGSVALAARLQVPIFSGFRVSANVAAAKLNREAAQTAARATARSVGLDVLRSYWSIRRLELQRTVSEKALQRYAEALVIVKARVNGGLAPPVDINRMDARRLRELARLLDLTGSAAEGRAQLAVVLQLGGAELELSESGEIPDAPPARPGEVDSLLAGALRDRPDLAAARLTRRSLEQQVRMARSAYYPQLGFGSLLQWGNAPWISGAVLAGQPANPFANTATAFVIGGTLSINLFDMLNTRTAVQDARYQVGLQEQEERRLGRLVELDVRTAHTRLLKLYRSREALLSAVTLARDTLDIVERRYKNGDALILDFLDAQFDLFNTESDVVDSTVAIALTWGELEAATGRIPGPPRRLVAGRAAELPSSTRGATP